MRRPSRHRLVLVGSTLAWPVLGLATALGDVELHIPRAGDDWASAGGESGAAEVREVHRLELGRGRNRTALDGVALGVDASSLAVTALQPDAPTVSSWSLDFDLADQSQWLQSLLGSRVMLRQGGTQYIGALLTAQSPVVLRDDTANLHAFASFDQLTALDPALGQSALPRVWLEIETDQVSASDYALHYRSTALSWRAQAIVTSTASGPCLLTLTVPLTVENQSGRGFTGARVELYDTPADGSRRRWRYRAPNLLSLPRAAPLQFDLVTAADAPTPCVSRNRVDFADTRDQVDGVRHLQFAPPPLRAGVVELPVLNVRWFERTDLEDSTFVGTVALSSTIDGRLELQAPLDGLRGVRRVIAERGRRGADGHELAVELALTNDHAQALALVVKDDLASHFNVPEASHAFTRALDSIEFEVQIAARSRVALRYVARSVR